VLLEFFAGEGNTTKACRFYGKLPCAAFDKDYATPRGTRRRRYMDINEAPGFALLSLFFCE
jgi:hypothetical protein